MTDLQNKVLESSELWKDITPTERVSLLRCIGSGVTAFGKGSIVWSAGDPVMRMGLVLSGEQRDAFGRPVAQAKNCSQGNGKVDASVCGSQNGAAPAPTASATN